MRDKRFFFLLLWLTLLPAAAKTQALPDNPETAVATSSAGWDPVEDLAHGEQITVTGAGRYSVPCRIAGATVNELFCDSLFSGREYRFNRAEVERVRMDDKRRNLKILIGTFAAAGLVWGVATPPPAGSAAPRFVGGLAGAAIGGFAGLVVSVPAALLIPGRLVYRHPPAHRKEGPPAPLAEQGPNQSNGGESVP